jgi:hypothetical protein
MKRAMAKAALTLLLGGAAGGLAWVFFPQPQSEVRSLLRVPNVAPGVARQAPAVPDLPTHQRDQIAMGKSRLVLSSALRDKVVEGLSLLANQGEPVSWLEKTVQIDFSIGPEIMRISMGGPRSEEAELEKLVNALRRAYLREVVDRDRSVRQERKDFLAKRLKNGQEALKVELQAPSRVAVLEEATVVRADTGMRKWIMTGGAALGGLLLALLAACWWERRRWVNDLDHVVSTPV